MIASTGTRADRDVEVGGQASPKPSARNNDTASDAAPKKAGFVRTVIVGENFQAGRYGTYASLFLLLVGMVGSVLGLNYAPMITLNQWTSGCKPGFSNSCKSSGAVLRFSMALSIIFVVLLIGTSFVTKFYDYLWFMKFFFFFGFMVLFSFLNAEIFDLSGYAWYARVAAFFYLIFQQIILIDLAYTWNEKWVKLSDEDAEHGYGCIWLFLLIVVSFTLILGSCAVVGVMFWQFGACADSLVILILTVILCAVATFLQIFVSEDGSVLTSSIIIAYATYICYSALTLNPNTVCNPTLSTGYQTVSQAVGMGITILSLLWAGTTTLSKIKELHAASLDTPEDSAVVVVTTYDTEGLKYILQEASLVFLLSASYFAMVLTNWATIQSNLTIASAKQGTAAMWIQAAGQWIAITFYIWSLAAPKLFPDRDFGVARNKSGE